MTQWQLLVAHWAKWQGPWRGQMDSTWAWLHSSSVSSDRDQPPAACPRCRALLSNIRMTDKTVARTATAADWLIITTASHRSANQRFFMHNSATVHRTCMQSTALDSSRSQLCSDTSTGVVRHRTTKWRRLQKWTVMLVRTVREEHEYTVYDNSKEDFRPQELNKGNRTKTILLPTLAFR